MKTLIALAIFGITTISFSACSQCYECSYELESTIGGTTVIDTVTEEVCTATGDEITEYESNGYTCELTGF